jgi:RNA polymerase primary sigma factor
MSNNRRIRKPGENALETYFREINAVPLLTPSEESALARRAKKGDTFAREKLIQANLRFVVNVARRYHARGLPLEDLVSEGNIGLITALDHFDPEKGYRFISYAVWWIRQTIMKAIGEKSRMIRLPQNKAQELLQIAKTREEMFGERFAVPETEAIAQKLHYDRRSVTELLAISRELLSLQAPVDIDGDFSPLEDFIEDKRGSQPEELLMKDSLRDDINRVMDSLSKRESEILQSRFGLNGKGPSTLKAIGRGCDLTKERIRQIEKNAIKHLRHPSQSRLLRAYI